MLEQLSIWWSITAAYIPNALKVFAGEYTLSTVIPAVGIGCLVLGILLALVWRERRTWLVLPILVIALATPLILALANSIAGWFGAVFAILVGAVLVLVMVGVVANDARRRLPVWLVGIFILSVAASLCLGAIAIIYMNAAAAA